MPCATACCAAGLAAKAAGFATVKSTVPGSVAGAEAVPGGWSTSKTAATFKLGLLEPRLAAALLAMLDSNDGELPARRLATSLGLAMFAGAFDGMSMLKEHDTNELLEALLLQLADTILRLTPVDAAMPSRTAFRAAELAANAAPLLTAMSVVPTI